jgi:hypothetical protein
MWWLAPIVGDWAGVGGTSWAGRVNMVGGSDCPGGSDCGRLGRSGWHLLGRQGEYGGWLRLSRLRLCPHLLGRLFEWVGGSCWGMAVRETGFFSVRKVFRKMGLCFLS